VSKHVTVDFVLKYKLRLTDIFVGFFFILKFASPCIIIKFKLINQLDATVSQVYYLTFM